MPGTGDQTRYCSRYSQSDHRIVLYAKKRMDFSYIHVYREFYFNVCNRNYNHASQKKNWKITG